MSFLFCLLRFVAGSFYLCVFDSIHSSSAYIGRAIGGVLGTSTLVVFLGAKFLRLPSSSSSGIVRRRRADATKQRNDCFAYPKEFTLRALNTHNDRKVSCMDFEATAMPSFHDERPKELDDDDDEKGSRRQQQNSSDAVLSRCCAMILTQVQAHLQYHCKINGLNC